MEDCRRYGPYYDEGRSSCVGVASRITTNSTGLRYPKDRRRSCLGLPNSTPSVTLFADIIGREEEV